MAGGCRVVASGCAPMTEVGGEAATYIDPSNPAAAAETIAQVLAEPGAVRQGYVKAGMLRAAQFTARSMAASYMSVYRDALDERRSAAQAIA
jgi:glycosyltransferase involved in cell wall biosynthesis